jgi:hypothetical protein
MTTVKTYLLVLSLVAMAAAALAQGLAGAMLTPVLFVMGATLAAAAIVAWTRKPLPWADRRRLALARADLHALRGQQPARRQDRRRRRHRRLPRLSAQAAAASSARDRAGPR